MFARLWQCKLSPNVNNTLIFSKCQVLQVCDMFRYEGGRKNISNRHFLFCLLIIIWFNIQSCPNLKVSTQLRRWLAASPAFTITLSWTNTMNLCVWGWWKVEGSLVSCSVSSLYVSRAIEINSSCPQVTQKKVFCKSRLKCPGVTPFTQNMAPSKTKLKKNI